MSNIEEIIENAIEKEIEIPPKIAYRINYALKNKKRPSNNYFRKFVLTTISILCIIIGSFGVYAVTGGTIEGIPATDWLGIRFSNSYVDYKHPVENQAVMFENTSVELTSTLCNEGITILEFDLKLSKEDYEKFKIGQSIITDEFIQEIEERKKNINKDVIINNLKSRKIDEAFQNNTYIPWEEVTVSDNEIETKVNEEIKKLDKRIEEYKTTFFIPALALNCEQIGGTYNYDKFNPNMEWYAAVFIDDKPYYVRDFQKTEKISDYEYKIYTMYMISDDILNDKESFKITLKNNKLVSIVDWQSSFGWQGNCQWFANENHMHIRDFNIPETPIIELNKNFEVIVSKNDILKDSLVIENPGIKSEFRNITQTVEKVVYSPVQTIVRINHQASKQSSNVFANRYSDPNIEYLPLTREYKVYDANGNELSCFATSNKNTLIYSDGTREDYDYHDIPNKKYSNAIWETVEYLLIENAETDYIKIVPVETIRNPVDENDKDSGEIYYEMDPLIINLK